MTDGWSLLLGGFGGPPPRMFLFKMFVEVILMHFRQFISCETKLTFVYYKH